MLRPQRAMRPWASMLLMLAAATLLRSALEPLLGGRAPFVAHYLLIVCVALFSGPWPAVAALVLSSAVLAEPLFGPLGASAQDALALTVHAVASAGLIALIERVRRAEGALQRERAARESAAADAAQRRLLETALESADAGVHSFDPATGQAQWDVRFRQLLGFTAEETATREALLARVHPDDRARVDAAVMKAMSTGGARRHSIEFRTMRDDGEVRWINSTGFAVFEGNQLVSVVGTARDVTERRRVEAALRESEQRFATLAEGSPLLLWVSGSRGNEFVNRAYLEFVGVDADQDVRGYAWSRYVHAEDRQSCLDAYQRASAAQTRFTAEFRFRRRDGEYRWMRSEATPRFGDDGDFQGHVGATVDITERREAQLAPGTGSGASAGSV
jgi:PAS domain S-box-containing protein